MPARTNSFLVVVEPDEGGFHAYRPALRALGAVTQGPTEAEAYRNIDELVQTIVDECHEDHVELPLNDRS